MEHEILDLIDRYWKFDNDQTPVSNWHDKQDLLEAVRKALRIHDVSGSCSPKEQTKPDKYEVIMAGNIMVAQGWKCAECGLIRAYDRPTCNCH